MIFTDNLYTSCNDLETTGILQSLLYLLANANSLYKIRSILLGNTNVTIQYLNLYKQIQHIHIYAYVHVYICLTV